jgi:hypothetical protein
MVEGAAGSEAWDRALLAAETEGAYTSLGSYPDEELLRIADHLAKEQNTRPENILRQFGRFAFSGMMQRCSHVSQRFVDSRGLLRGLNGVVHPEVQKLYPDSITPDFQVVRESSTMLELEYRSVRSLCGFALGMAAGAIDYFDERAQVSHPKCRVLGDSVCLLRIEYSPK